MAYVSEIRLKNFRAFSGQVWRVPLAELTVLTGTNGSGKSSLLKSLLLLAQSIERSPVEMSKTGRIRFNGKYIDLGSYPDVVTANDIDEPILIGISVTDQIPRSATLEKLLRSHPNGESLLDRVKPERGRSLSCTVKCDFTIIADRKKPIDPSEKAPARVSGVLQKGIFSIEVEETVITEIRVVRSKGSSPTYRIEIPDHVFNAFDGETLFRGATRRRTGYYTMQVYMEGLLPRFLFTQPKAKHGGKSTSGQIAVALLPPVIQEMIDQVRKLLISIAYLEPLRSAGKRLYLLDQEEQSDFAGRGESLPYILRDQIDRKILFFFPHAPTVMEEATLGQFLNAWLGYIRTGKLHNGDSIQIDAVFQSDLLGSVLVAGECGGLHSLADSGFGYSQMLPILVAGLLARSGSILIVEQPELHLNPALQVRLALFFLVLMNSGRQVIVESHSEHLVNSLRIETVEWKGSPINSRISINFIESQNGQIVVHDMGVLGDGSFSEWPKAFFGEALELSSRLLKAQSAARSKNF